MTLNDEALSLWPKQCDHTCLSYNLFCLGCTHPANKVVPALYSYTSYRVYAPLEHVVYSPMSDNIKTVNRGCTHPYIYIYILILWSSYQHRVYSPIMYNHFLKYLSKPHHWSPPPKFPQLIQKGKGMSEMLPIVCLINPIKYHIYNITLNTIYIQVLKCITISMIQNMVYVERMS